MNPKQYTWSVKDRKFLATLMFLQFSLVMLTISVFGWYWHTETEDCRKIWKKIELSEWATEEVNKANADFRLEKIKQSYKNQGISAEEF